MRSEVHLITNEPTSERLASTDVSIWTTFKRSADRAESFEDFEHLILRSNELLKSDQLTSDQKQIVRRIRQRAYDRRRKLKPNQSTPNTPRNPISVVSNQNKPEITPTTQQPPTAQGESPTPVNLLVVGAISVLLCLSGWLLWDQAVSLYKASGFSEPAKAAIGGFVMMIGFAVYHATHRSTLSLIMCAAVVIFEIYFMVAASMDQSTVHTNAAIHESQRVIFLNQQAERAQNDYQRVLAKYENPDAKVFNNQWYKKTYVDPAWKAYSNVQATLESTKAQMEEEFDALNGELTKIIYRIFLTMMVMLFTHELISTLGKSYAYPRLSFKG